MKRVSVAWESARGLGGTQGKAPVGGRISPEIAILCRQYVWNVNRPKGPKKAVFRDNRIIRAVARAAR